MLKNEFVTYEQAKALKELGFDEPCLFAAYDGETLQSIYKKFISHLPCTSAPLRQQVLRWFRENKKLVFYINMVDLDLYYFVINFGEEIGIFLSNHYKTYEESENFLINKLIEILKNK
jgi:hypothetical protein